MSEGASQRYARHLVLREVGTEGQERIRRAAIRVVGDGPAAEEAAFYLTAAGVGRLIVDTPLWLRHGERLAELNPEVRFVTSAIDLVEVVATSQRRAEGAAAALEALLGVVGRKGPAAGMRERLLPAR